jgi:hypothetical protein
VKHAAALIPVVITGTDEDVIRNKRMNSERTDGRMGKIFAQALPNWTQCPIGSPETSAGRSNVDVLTASKRLDVNGANSSVGLAIEVPFRPEGTPGAGRSSGLNFDVGERREYGNAENLAQVTA